jgi:cytidine deaminase
VPDDLRDEHPDDVAADLPDDIDVELLDAARAARGHAYAPYSKFRMGAAVRTHEDEIVRGALVENVSLGLAMCAERVALFGTVTTGHRPVRLALVAPRTDDALTYPCGACLQVALELGGPDVEIVVSDIDGTSEISTVGALLPRGPRRA